MPVARKWRRGISPHQWALPLYVSWISPKFFIVHFLCFYVAYESWEPFRD